MRIEQLKDVVSKPSSLNISPPKLNDVAESIAFLSSGIALESIQNDPYWPKWNGPWWHMLMLTELGAAKSIPEVCVMKVLEVLDDHYLSFFPFTEAEIPEGKNPYRHIMCHCALGSLEQILFSWGLDVPQRIPWIRPWYIKYQLPDGGLNCDEAAYTKERRKSSIVSTLPPLEAVLHCSPRPYTNEELEFMSSGAIYLIERQLCRQASTGNIIDETWLKLCFPRFYHYDVLRGLNWVVDWALKTKNKLPIAAIEESVILIDTQFPDGKIRVQRNACIGSKTWKLEQDDAEKNWVKVAAGSFPLLDSTSEPGLESLQLSKKWANAKSSMLTLINLGLIA